MIYEEQLDLDLITRYQNGDEYALEVLMARHKGFIRLKAKTYYLIGSAREDVLQEARIGFYKAVRDYRHEKATSFRSFAELCITRQIITAIKSATRQKHAPLNTYTSFSKTAFGDESDRTLIEILATNSLDPADLFAEQETMASIKKIIKDKLSPLERDVLRGYFEGHSYQEMADIMGRQIKSIDNALQRVKRKLESTFGS